MFLFFFFNDTATTEIYTLSLHDALPILKNKVHRQVFESIVPRALKFYDLPDLVATLVPRDVWIVNGDRKSTRLNSSHVEISYAVFCLKKKKQNEEKTCFTTKSNRLLLY